MFKTFSEKYLCHQPAINAKNFSNYLYYVPTSSFSEDPTNNSKWIIGMDHLNPMYLELKVGSVTEIADETDTIACPMINKQLSSDVEERLPLN